MNRRPEPEEVRAAWDTLAPYWDEQMKAGNTWQRNLIQPAVERLLGIAPGELVLEIACGNGLFARRMAELGARVLGTDFSEPMLNRARAYGGDVEYRLADAADETALLALGEAASFDAVVCNMAIMDMVEIEPMIAASSKLLRRDGRFVFSTVHPAFNGEATRVLEQTEDERGVVRTHSSRSHATSGRRLSWGSPSRASRSCSGTFIARSARSSRPGSGTASSSTESRNPYSRPTPCRLDQRPLCSPKCHQFSSRGCDRCRADAPRASIPG